MKLTRKEKRRLRRNERLLKRFRKFYSYVYRKQVQRADTLDGWAYIRLVNDIEQAYIKFNEELTK